MGGRSRMILTILLLGFTPPTFIYVGDTGISGIDQLCPIWKGKWSQQVVLLLGLHPQQCVGDSGVHICGSCLFLLFIFWKELVTASYVAVGFHAPNNLLVTLFYISFLSQHVYAVGYLPPTLSWWHNDLFCCMANDWVW